MRIIESIIVHCADTRTDQNFSVKDVREWHKTRGFNDVGYHYYIRLSGSIEKGRPIEKIGAHCEGHNSRSIGICFEGGKNPNGSKWDKPKTEQINSFKSLYESLINRFGELSLHGHYMFSSHKTCPNFDPCILIE